MCGKECLPAHTSIRGRGLWLRFNVKDPASHAWYYRQLVKSLSPLSDTDAYQEFVRLVDQVFHADKYR